MGPFSVKSVTFFIIYCSLVNLVYSKHTILKFGLSNDTDLWDSMRNCPDNNSFVNGLALRFQYKTDKEVENIAVTAIRFYCTKQDVLSEKENDGDSFDVEIEKNSTGIWAKDVYCGNGVVTGIQVKLGQEDKPLVENMRVQCSDGEGLQYMKEDEGYWTDTDVVESCQSRHAICGMQSQLLQSAEASPNSIRFKCCNIPDISLTCNPKKNWHKISDCENPIASTRKTCHYSKKIGLSYAGKYKEAGIYEDLGFHLTSVGDNLQNKLDEITVDQLNESNEDDEKNWKIEKENVEEFDEISAEPGMRATIYQLVGHCGFYKVKYNSFKLVAEEISATPFSEEQKDKDFERKKKLEKKLRKWLKKHKTEVEIEDELMHGDDGDNPSGSKSAPDKPKEVDSSSSIINHVSEEDKQKSASQDVNSNNNQLQHQQDDSKEEFTKGKPDSIEDESIEADKDWDSSEQKAKVGEPATVQDTPDHNDNIQEKHDLTKEHEIIIEIPLYEVKETQQHKEKKPDEVDQVDHPKPDIEMITINTSKTAADEMLAQLKSDLNDYDYQVQADDAGVGAEDNHDQDKDDWNDMDYFDIGIPDTKVGTESKNNQEQKSAQLVIPTSNHDNNDHQMLNSTDDKDHQHGPDETKNAPDLDHHQHEHPLQNVSDTVDKALEISKTQSDIKDVPDKIDNDMIISGNSDQEHNNESHAAIQMADGEGRNVNSTATGDDTGPAAAIEEDSSASPENTKVSNAMLGYIVGGMVVGVCIIVIIIFALERRKPSASAAAASGGSSNSPGVRGSKYTAVNVDPEQDEKRVGIEEDT